MEFDPIFDNISISNVIPGFSTVTEDAMYTIASVEESYTNIMKEIGIYELSLVMEADDAEKNEKQDTKNIFKKFVDFVKGLIGRIAELVQKAIDKVEYMIVQKTKAINDIMKISVGDLVKASEDLYDNNREKYDKLWGAGALKTQIRYNKSYANTLKSNMETTVTNVEEMLEKLNKDSKIEDFDIAEAVAKGMSTSKLEITKADIAEIGKFKAKITEALIETSKVNFSNGADTYIKDSYKNISTAKSDFKNNIKDPYMASKKKFDAAVKKARKANNSKDFKPLFKSTALCAKLFAALIGAVETSYIRSTAWDYRVVFKATVIAASAKKAAKKSTNESASFESTTFQSELKSLFTF